MTPDFNDPDVVEMFVENHKPQELWTTTGILSAITCKTCGAKWPCQISIAAKEAVLRDRRRR